MPRRSKRLNTTVAPQRLKSWADEDEDEALAYNPYDNEEAPLVSPSGTPPGKDAQHISETLDLGRRNERVYIPPEVPGVAASGRAGVTFKSDGEGDREMYAKFR